MEIRGFLKFFAAFLPALLFAPAVDAAPLWLDCTAAGVHSDPDHIILVVADDRFLFRFIDGRLEPGIGGSENDHPWNRTIIDDARIVTEWRFLDDGDFLTVTIDRHSYAMTARARIKWRKVDTIKKGRCHAIKPLAVSADSILRLN